MSGFLELEDLDDDIREYLITGDFVTRPLLPRNEFEETFGRSTLAGPAKDTAKDSFGIFSGLGSMYQHISYTEFIIITSASIGMTFFFCYYLYPVSPDEAYLLSARLRFTIIVTAVLFPSMMLVNESMKRREIGLQKYASIKAILCNLLLAFLSWRAKSIVMTADWEDKSYEVVRECANMMKALLLLPTIRDRHAYTKQGRAFAAAVLNRRELIHARLTCLNFELHRCVEDMKEQGLSPMESIRLFQYINFYSRDCEQAWNIKFFRTTQAGRVYTRIILSACIMFYGPYYSYVAGAIPHQAGEMTIAFSVVLTALSTITLLAIVAMHRALEDPFFWWYPGNAVDVKFETDDALDKLESIYRAHKLSPSLKRASRPIGQSVMSQRRTL